MPQNQELDPSATGLENMMRDKVIRAIRLAAVVVCLGASGAMAQLPVVPGEPSLTPKDFAPAPKLRVAPKMAPDVRLAPLADSEYKLIRDTNRLNQKRLAIGVVRTVSRTLTLPAAGDLAWKAVPGGFAAQASLNSPEAGALRLEIALAGVPEDVEMVFFGSDAPARLVGPVRVGDIADRTAPWWSPVTDGETQSVEFFVPARHQPRALSLRLTGASHLFTTVASGFVKRVSDIGDAGACNVDIKCSSLASSQPFLNARNAVAQMIFNDGSSTFLCTGTLLNDTVATTQVPWFYSANHCFENNSLPFKTPSQMQAVANTLNTLWSFEAVACNAKTAPPSTQLTGGATFIDNKPGADVLFLRLNNAVPAGAYFSGWDPNAIPLGATAVTIHHPQGDLKKVSEGTVQRYSSPPVLGGATAPFTEMRWHSGTTEGGSSGGGLFTFDGSQYLLRGGLWGGSALCSNPNGTDNYSRFDQVYGGLSNYLNPTSAPTVNYTDMWWNAGESGWGLNVIQHASGSVFVVWFTYGSNGKRTWYHVPTGTWTSPTRFTGTIYATAGPGFDGTFDSNLVTRTPVGTGTLSFTDANNGTWTFSVNGLMGTKVITRLAF